MSLFSMEFKIYLAGRRYEEQKSKHYHNFVLMNVTYNNVWVKFLFTLYIFIPVVSYVVFNLLIIH